MPGLERLAHVIRRAAGEPEAALVLMSWVQDRRASAPLP